jgi:predicted metal-binding membrane protein
MWKAPNQLSAHAMHFPNLDSLRQILASLLVSFALLVMTQHAWAAIKVANQILGKSTVDDVVALPSKSFSIQKAITDYSGGEVLWVVGPVIANTKGSASLLYDANKRLVAAFIWESASATELLKKLARSAHAKPRKDKSFTVDDWHMRIEGSGEKKYIAISTPSFDAQLQRDAQRREKERNQRQRLILIASVVVGTIAAYFIYLMFRMKRKNRGWAPQNTTMYLEKKTMDSVKSSQPARLASASTGAAILATASGISYANASDEETTTYRVPNIHQNVVAADDHSVYDSAPDTTSSFDTYDYCEPAVNCANGMPMHNGVDGYGNFYGSNFNDPW